MTLAPDSNRPVKRVWVRSKDFEIGASDLEGAFPLDLPGVWGAIAIGPRSDMDACLIMPGSAGCPVSVPPFQLNVASTVYRTRAQDALKAAIAVSVERPFIGPITGPFRVMSPYHDSAAYQTSTPRRMRVPGVSDLWTTHLHSGPAMLELEFYPCIPPWLPTKRAPLKYAFAFPNFGDAAGPLGGSADVTIRVPVFGRRLITLSLEMGGRSAGSMGYTVSGRNLASAGELLTEIDNVEVLQAEVTASADFDDAFTYDGEFDELLIRLREVTALNAGVTVNGILKAFD